MSIYEQVPFPLVELKPTKLSLELQRRIKYMFGITVDPTIVRLPGSYYKTIEFRFMWSMRTPCGRYEISCFESALDMVKKPAWHVLDTLSLLSYPIRGRAIGKVIY